MLFDIFGEFSSSKFSVNGLDEPLWVFQILEIEFLKIFLSN